MGIDLTAKAFCLETQQTRRGNLPADNIRRISYMDAYVGYTSRKAMILAKRIKQFGLYY
jgi:hypothetical protein